MTWRITAPHWLAEILVAAGAHRADTNLANEYHKTGGRAPSADERVADQEALKAGTLPLRQISLDGTDWERTPQRMAEKAALDNILDYLHDDKEHP